MASPEGRDETAKFSPRYFQEQYHLNEVFFLLVCIFPSVLPESRYSDQKRSDSNIRGQLSEDTINRLES